MGKLGKEVGNLYKNEKKKKRKENSQNGCQCGRRRHLANHVCEMLFRWMWNLLLSVCQSHLILVVRGANVCDKSVRFLVAEESRRMFRPYGDL